MSPSIAPTPSTAETFYDRYWSFRIERGDHEAGNRIKLRHEQAAAFIKQRLADRPEGRVIDLGCGDALLAQALQPHEYHLVGTDIADRALRLAEPYCAEVRQLDLDTDDTPPQWMETFDAVACLEVLEHLERPRRNIARSFELLRPRGFAVFSFPNLFSWKNRFCFLRGRWPSGYTTYDPREHLQVFELDEFQRWCRDAGLTLLGTSITPDLPRFRPARRAMFSWRGLLNALCPTLAAMQINVYAQRPGEPA